MKTDISTMIFAAVVLLTAALPVQSVANEPYLEEHRQAYIASVLQAFDASSMLEIANTYEYISVAERNHCRSNLSDLRTDCLLSYARKNCAATGGADSQGYCQLYSDVIVINKLSTKTFIDRTERYRMLTNNDVAYKDALTSRLQQKYARIVTEFALSDVADCGTSDFACLAKGLDEFCLDYANTKSLSWQHCVGASVWFIGTAKQED